MPCNQYTFFFHHFRILCFERGTKYCTNYEFLMQLPQQTKISKQLMANMAKNMFLPVSVRITPVVPVHSAMTRATAVSATKLAWMRACAWKMVETSSRVSAASRMMGWITRRKNISMTFTLSGKAPLQLHHNPWAKMMSARKWVEIGSVPSQKNYVADTKLRTHKHCMVEPCRQLQKQKHVAGGFETTTWCFRLKW